MQPPTAEDLAWLTQTLGRTPKRVVGIPVRDAAGRPRVIVNHPLPEGLGGPPLPNLCWLVDPALVVRVSRLERAGGVKQAEGWLAAEPARLAALQAEHAEYARRRWALLGADERAALAGTPAEAVLRNSGIAGVGERGRPALKCLHAHLAWSLWLAAERGAPSVAGEWLAARGIPG